jgi:phosphomannomutase
MQVSPSIFKAYDIRGIVPATVNEAMAEALGRAFGTVARFEGETRVAVGRDGRLSGPSLSAALMRGLMAAGIEVIDVGMATTPMLYFAANTLCTSGIQVTGSHNPRDYNGFKMVLAGRAIYGEEIQSLRSMMETESWSLQAGGVSAAGPSQSAKAPSGGSAARASSAPANDGAVASVGAGHLRQVDVTDAYRQRIVGDVKLARPMKIVVDSGNGVAGATAPAILRALGCEVTELFSEVDGNFPNHHPDPSKPENLRELIAALQSGDAELGLAFDGDGDRLGIVTKDGQTIYPDRQMMLFARDVLSRVPGGTIVFDVKCSQRLAPAIVAVGGKPLMYKTGHSLIKAKMKEIDSPLGGEMSGHIFFKERWFGFDDGTYAAARLLEILSRSKDANAVLHALPTSFSTPELNVACEEGEPHALVAALVGAAAKAMSTAGPSRVEPPLRGLPEGAKASGPSEAQGAPAPGSRVLREAISVGAKISTIDGLRVDWPDGFGLIRASNTTPVLVLRFEGQTEAALQRIEAAMMALLKSVKPDAVIQQAAH